MDRKCTNLRWRCSSFRMEDTLGKAFLRYQQQRGQCLCRDCVAKAKHFTIRVHKMLEVQSLYKPTPPHQPTAKRRRLRLTSVPLVDLRAPADDSGSDVNEQYGLLNSPPRSLTSDVDACSLSTKSGICSISESMDSQRLGTSSIRIKHLNSSWESESRFPKLNECAHFHYELVELGPINVCLYNEAHENSKWLANGDLDRGENFAVQVSSNGKSWVVRRTFENFRMLDRQLHQCIYDRKFSSLKEITKDDGQLEYGAEKCKEAVVVMLKEYLQRFSDIAGNLINCGPILNWLELDNRGNRLIVTDDSAINTPAVAAAYVTKRYTAQATDEISFEVGDMISVIDMPPPEESIWWRGKRGFEVGFFPSECVEVIGDKVPHTIHIPKAPTKPVLRKHGKLIAFFRSFVLSRPSRRKLKQSGILKERVFGCDLGEHLLNSGHEIPMVLKYCAEFIEAHGIVDGIYRLSGVTSNIQKLRNTFDEDRVPDLNDEAFLQDIHCVASLLKMYFRELPNPLLTYQLYDKFVSAVQSEEDVRLLNIRDVVQQLPPPHYRTLEYLVKHLATVAAHGAETGMTPKNVAIVWAPNLLRSKDLEVGGVAALQVVGVQAVVTEFLIRYSDLIFNDKMPVFPPCPGSTGTPKKNRPKSLAISTPTKLLSLEEARSRALVAVAQHNQKYIEVGGGPANLPSKYHTIIDLPDRKRGSTKNKKSPSGWKSFFSKGKSSQSPRERDKSKSRRKGSTTPSDPGITVNLSVGTGNDMDASCNNNRLRSVKSAESLVSTMAASSHRNSDNIDSGTICIPGSGHNGIGDTDGGTMLSSSLGAVPSSQMRQSPHSHVRSISHDSYFEFAFDRRQEDKPIGELSTIMSEENDDDDDSDRVVMDDFCDVATDLDLMKLHYVDQDTDINIIGHVNDGLESVALGEVSMSLASRIYDASNGRRPPDIINVYSSDKILNEGSDTLASDSLQEQLSLDFDNGHCDIVGDIQQEVAAALHWDQPALTNFKPPLLLDEENGRSSDSISLANVNHAVNSKDTSKAHSKTVVERYGSERTVIVEVHATEDSSAEDEEEELPDSLAVPNMLSYESHEVTAGSERSDIVKDDLLEDSLSCSHPLLSPLVSDLVLFDSIDVGGGNLVQKRDVESQNQESFTGDEYSILDRRIKDVPLTPSPLSNSDKSVGLTSENLNESICVTSGSTFSEGGIEDISNLKCVFPSVDTQISNAKVSDCGVNYVENETDKEIVSEIFPRIFVRESTLPAPDEKPVGFLVNCIDHNEDETILPSTTVSGLEPVCTMGFDSDSTPGSHVNSHDEVTSNTSPSGASDPFGYSVLMNEEEAPMSPVCSDDIRPSETFEVHHPPSNQLRRDDDSKTEPFICLISPIGESKETAFRNDSSSVNSQISSLPKISSGLASQIEGGERGGIDHLPLQTNDICPLDAEFIPSSLPSPLLPSRESDDITLHLRKPSLYLEKLSPVEESKRKFESEIGRDILRERKMKLELEKIQLEQQKFEKVSPSRSDCQNGETKVTTPSDRLPKSSSGDDMRFPLASPSNALNFEVELRRQKSHNSQYNGTGVTDSKRTSEPSLGFGNSQPTTPDSMESKRHSEPVPYTGKGARPERKASVRELMSKFEGKPRVQKRGTTGKDGQDEPGDVSSRKLQLSLKVGNAATLKNDDSDGQHQEDTTADCLYSKNQENENVTELSSPLPINLIDVSSGSSFDKIFSMSSSFPSSNAKLEKILTSPNPEHDSLSHESTTLSCTSVTNDAGDAARRERIDRYKEERRAQLRERIKSESFRGEQDVHSDYLAKLKQKASSPMKSVGSLDDITALPPSPSRRGRFSTTSLESPTESETDRESLSTIQRRSFNARTSTNYLSSPTGSEEAPLPVTPPKVVLDKKCGLPIPPPSSPRKTIRSERVNTGDATSESSRSRFGMTEGMSASPINRPKEFPCQKQDGLQGQSSPRRMSSPKASPTDTFASRKLKSPMKERTCNLPPSPTKDKYITCKDDDICLKDVRGTKSSPVTENVPSGVGMKHKAQKGRIPVPPPRKIKEVAAIFEPGAVVGSRDHQSEDSCSKPRPTSKPAPGNIQRQTSLSATDSSSSISAQRLRSKHLSGPD